MAVVLIIGASRGLGLEFVRQYTEAGDRVIATVRDAAGRARVQALGAEVLTVDANQPVSLIKAAQGRFVTIGRLFWSRFAPAGCAPNWAAPTRH